MSVLRNGTEYLPTTMATDTFCHGDFPQSKTSLKKPVPIESGRGDASEEVPLVGLSEAKTPRPDAPWMRDEPDEFEDLQESDIAKKKEEIADRALISAVKTVAELSRA